MKKKVTKKEENKKVASPINFKQAIIPKGIRQTPLIAIQKVVIPQKALKEEKEAQRGEVVKVEEEVNIVPPPERKRLNLKQEAFCYQYAADPESYGNQTKAYAIAHQYEIDWSKQARYQKFTKKELKLYRTAATLASLMMKNVDILNRVDEVRQEFVDDRKVDFEIGRTILQNKDWSSKIKAAELHKRLAGKLIDKSEQIQKHQFIGIIKHVYDKASKPKDMNGPKPPTEQ